MRLLALFLMLVFLRPVPARAQAQPTPDDSTNSVAASHDLNTNAPSVDPAATVTVIDQGGPVNGTSTPPDSSPVLPPSPASLMTDAPPANPSSDVTITDDGPPLSPPAPRTVPIAKPTPDEARWLLVHGKSDQALTTINSVLRDDPGNVKARTLRGIILVHQQRWDDAG